MIYLYVTPEGSVNLIEGEKMPVKHLITLSFLFIIVMSIARYLKIDLRNCDPSPGDGSNGPELGEGFLFT